MTDTSGPTSRPPLAHYAPDGSCWKTWQVMSLWGWTPFSETWPRWGMTRSGALYELPTPAPRTAGPECSSLLPTPEAKLAGSGPDYARANRPGAGGDDLTTTLHRLLPTPTATPYGNNQSPSPGAAVRPSLNTLAITLLPTPSVADGTGGHATRSGARSSELLLPGVAKAATDGKLLPTPTTAMDSAGSGGSTAVNVTLTDAVVRTSLGAHTNLRLPAGPPSSDGQLPGQLSLEHEADSA